MSFCSRRQPRALAKGMHLLICPSVVPRQRRGRPVASPSGNHRGTRREASKSLSLTHHLAGRLPPAAYSGIGGHLKYEDGHGDYCGRSLPSPVPWALNSPYSENKLSCVPSLSCRAFSMRVKLVMHAQPNHGNPGLGDGSSTRRVHRN